MKRPARSYLTLYNTETKAKEEIIPLDGQTIRLYTCGPTVYNFAHIGNFRTYIAEDLLRRTLKFFGADVQQAMNLTDVDDKTIKGALEEKVPLKVFVQRYINAFFEDLKTLHIEPAEFYPAATHYIPEMIRLIQKLLEKGLAYRSQDGSIYFAITRFPSYGRLSHLHLDELKGGASERIARDEYDKESIADFVLWKAVDPARDGDIFWESPFGNGRPGWHIECSAMAMSLLGESIDIHVGGVDNMFPHHENEIAQSEGCSGKRFVAHWMHVEHLLVDHKKMSKSLGNFYTLRDLLQKGYSGVQVRYMLLQGHYRSQQNFTFQGLDGACAALERLDDFIARLQDIKEGKETKDVESILHKAADVFREALADDLNISSALAALFDLVREVNALCDEGKVGPNDADHVLLLLREFDQVLGVLTFDKSELSVPVELLEILERRERARHEKNWAIADEARNILLSRGYVIEDTASGARLKKKKGME
ncbi:MAG: cysteine--tRNA ligase [Anaerolineae bacterium]